MRRTFYLSPVGTSRRQLILPNAYQIAGVIIDNPSGSWLALSTGDFVRPYTLGYARSFPTLIASLDVLYINGPAGQLSSFVGDVPTVILDSDRVVDNPGMASGGDPFVSRQEQPEMLTDVFQTSMVNPGNVTRALLGSLTKRLRIFASIAQNADMTQANRIFAPVTIRCAGSTAFGPPVIAAHDIDPNKDTSGGWLPQGAIDLPLGSELFVNWNVNPGDGPAFINVIHNYAII